MVVNWFADCFPWACPALICLVWKVFCYFFYVWKMFEIVHCCWRACSICVSRVNAYAVSNVVIIRLYPFVEYCWNDLLIVSVGQKTLVTQSHMRVFLCDWILWKRGSLRPSVTSNPLPVYRLQLSDIQCCGITNQTFELHFQLYDGRSLKAIRYMSG